MAFDWPAALTPRRCDPHLRNFAKSGGRTVTSREQRVFSDAGFWELSFEVPVHNAVRARAARALMGRLRQGEEVNAVVYDRMFAEGADNVGSSAVLSGSHVLRATQIVISAVGLKPEAGVLFSIGNRLHQITSIVSGGPATFFNPVTTDGPWDDDQPWADAAPSAVNFTAKIVPPLRAAYANGQALKFKDLKLVAVLAEMGDGDLSLELGRFGTHSLTLRESI